MQIESLVLQIGNHPGFTTNCYIVSESAAARHCLVIDPAAEAARIIAALGDRTVDAIIITHKHGDHTGALAALERHTGAAIYAHRLDSGFIADEVHSGARSMRLVIEPPAGDIMALEDGDTVSTGPLRLTVMHTPGHTPGSLCLYDPQTKVLFSGDTLFRGTTGRTDLPTGSPAQMHDSLIKLATLPDDTVVYPGHDQPTSIGQERSRALIEY